MRNLVIVFFLVISSRAIAGDAWFCKEASSQRRGDSVYSCGIGTGKEESIARLNAFDNSMIEFNRICNASGDCKNHSITIRPERTSCENENNQYKCYRLIVFTIGLTAAASGQSAGQRFKENDLPDRFEPFVYEKTLQFPKVKKGMSKKELLGLFGVPVSTYELDQGRSRRVIFYYQGKMCMSDRRCEVIFHDTDLESWSDFKPIYSGDLE